MRRETRRKVMAVALGTMALGLMCSTSTSASAGECRDPWITQAITQAIGAAPTDSGDSGWCNIYNYNNGNWNSYDELFRAVVDYIGRHHGHCNDRWITVAFYKARGRWPEGYGTSGDCNPYNYGGGQWNSYDDLVNKVRAASATIPTDFMTGGTFAGTTPTPVDRAVLSSSYQLNLARGAWVSVPGGYLIGNDSGGISFYDYSGNMVAAGGGNVVPTGGGSMVAAGGGNVQIYVGGQMVAAGGGNLLSDLLRGGANLVGNDGASLTQAKLAQILSNANAGLTRGGQTVPEEPAKADIRRAIREVTGRHALPDELDPMRFGSEYSTIRGHVERAYYPCSNDNISIAVLEVLDRPARGAENQGECNPLLYGGGKWQNYKDLKSKVRRTLVTEPYKVGQCRDREITRAINEVKRARRMKNIAASGRGELGECNMYLYGNGHWSSYADLKEKVGQTLNQLAASNIVLQPDNSIRPASLERGGGGGVLAALLAAANAYMQWKAGEQQLKQQQQMMPPGLQPGMQPPAGQPGMQPGAMPPNAMPPNAMPPGAQPGIIVPNLPGMAGPPPGGMQPLPQPGGM